MHVSSLSLENFRSYKELHISFEDKLNVIQGANASGKTNLIEAIYYLSLARSFKKANDKDLIKIGADNAKLILKYETSSKEEHVIEATILPNGKIITFDNEKQKSVTKIVGKLLSIVYSPSSVSLFRGEPMERRRFIDTTLSLMSDKYLYALMRQKKLLKERNTALNQNYDEDVMSVITKELVNVSYRLYIDRKAFILKANESVGSIYKDLFGGEEKIEVSYLTNVPQIDNQEQFVAEYLKKMDSIKTEERIRTTTLIGIQKDDIISTLDGKNLYAYASQGQNRLSVLSLVIASSQILEDHFKEKPILLLDDVMSDLDDEHKSRLAKYLSKKGQVFITSADEERLVQDADYYLVSNGNIERR